MSNTLAQDFVATFVAGLNRASIVTCSQWATKYRVMNEPFPGPMSYIYHPWLIDIQDSKSLERVGQKAAQMGYTEAAINLTFYSMDILGKDVLYLLPTSTDASDFSATRFNPALINSDYLRGFFCETDNVHLKRSLRNSLYVRGSHSRSKLKSIPTPVIIFDELDEMPKQTVALAEERQSGQRVDSTLIFKLSTPTITGYGINLAFNLSNQKYYHFKCPGCSRYITLDYPQNFQLVGDGIHDIRLRDSFFKCHLCDKKLDFDLKKDFLKHKSLGGTGEFVATYPDREIDGFCINQMYSMAKAGLPYELAKAVLLAETDPTREQELYNSKLAKTHSTKGAKVDDNMFSDKIRNHKKKDYNFDTFRTMGIDVGLYFHVVIYEWYFESKHAFSMNERYRPKLVLEDKTHEIEEVFQWFNDARCIAAVIDAEPERRLSISFAQRLPGRIYTCDYLYTQAGREVIISEEELTLKVNRTAWLDLMFSRYKNKQGIMLPSDVSEEFRQNIKEPTRVFREDKWGQPYGVYLNVGPDHFAHASTYAEIALPLGVAIGSNQDIQDLY